MGDQRGWKLAYAYSEYVDACEAAGERAYAYSTFCLGLREWRRDAAAAGVPEWFPGEYVRTYWATGAARVAGEEVPFPVFVAVMDFSGAAFACRAADRGTKRWMRCCARAFEWLGGVPYVTDCTQSKVSSTARDTLEAFARHYGTVLYGSRPKTGKTSVAAAKPIDAKSTSAVARRVLAEVAQVEFADLADLDAFMAGKVWGCNAAADGESGERPPRDVLEERELPQMLSLPKGPHDFAEWSSREVRADYHFTVRGVRYSVPWRHCGETVRVCWTGAEVRAYSNGELVARHARMAEPRGRCTVTDPAHRPPSHRWFADRMDERFLSLAREEGPNVVRAMKRVLASCKQSGRGFRECKELLDLKGTPSAVALDEACAVALSEGGKIDAASVRAKMGGAA